MGGRGGQEDAGRWEAAGRCDAILWKRYVKRCSAGRDSFFVKRDDAMRFNFVRGQAGRCDAILDCLTIPCDAIDIKGFTRCDAGRVVFGPKRGDGDGTL